MSESEKNTIFGAENLEVLTKSFEDIGHKLVARHVDESTPQTVVRQHQEHLHQDVIDAVQVLNTNNACIL